MTSNQLYESELFVQLLFMLGQLFIEQKELLALTVFGTACG